MQGRKSNVYKSWVIAHKAGYIATANHTYMGG